MSKVENPSAIGSLCQIYYTTAIIVHKSIMTSSIQYLSQAEVEPRNNFGHKDATSAYFLSTIRWSRYLEPTY